MAKFDMLAYMDEFTNGQVKLDIRAELKNEFGEKVAYDYQRENGNLTILVDGNVFAPADKKVAEALVNNVSFNSKEREKAEELLAEFVNREGRYIKIKEREEKELEKERMRLQKEQEKQQKEEEKAQREEVKALIKDIEGADLKTLYLMAKEMAKIEVAEVTPPSEEITERNETEEVLVEA